MDKLQFLVLINNNCPYSFCLVCYLQLQDPDAYEFDDAFTRCVLCHNETPDLFCHMRILHPGCGSTTFLWLFWQLLGCAKTVSVTMLRDCILSQERLGADVLSCVPLLLPIQALCGLSGCKNRCRNGSRPDISEIV